MTFTSPASEFDVQVLEALRERQATVRPCPMCTARSWTLVSGVVMDQTYQIAGRIISPSARLPSVALVCNSCGFVAFYSLVVLGLGHLVPN